MNRILNSWVGASLLLAISACQPAPLLPTGELRVVTRNAPTSYFLDSHGLPAGPEYEAVAAFAEFLKLPLRIMTVDTTAEVLAMLTEGEADLAAAGLTMTEQREYLRFGPPLRQVNEQMVCRRGRPVPAQISDLGDRTIAVTEDSSYLETLQALQQEHPSLRWTVLPAPTEQLLEQVWNRSLDCVVADSSIVNFNRRYFPELVVAFDLSEARPQAWAVSEGSRALRKRILQWFNSAPGNQTMARIERRYFEFLPEFDYVDVRAFTRRIKQRYKKYEALFASSAEAHGLDPYLLAAQAYQESHWNPGAVSPTGVRGMMMLTLNTARSLGVKDRHDAAQSIAAGAVYLASLRARLPDSVLGKDRDFQALAAYNVGPYHLDDARTLAARLGEDPDRWSSLREVLPLLANERYYRDLPYGYARGSEPVRYVSRIRNFRDILHHHQDKSGR